MARISPNPVFQLLDQGGDVIATINNNGSSTIAPGAAGVGVFGLQSKTILTSAQLLAIKGTPQTLIPAAGPGTVIVVNQVTFRYLFGGTAFTLNAGTLKIFEGPPANAKAVTPSVATGLIDQAVNMSNLGVPATASGNLTDAQAVNVGITIANDGAAEFTLGNGTLEVITDYLIFNLP